ncbi:MAG TPA: autotransporter-associated beta strand repeat-containing protein [Pirellulales bacterium]|nr:autotransporter-associated beta strand repeat-containing protein [Pirellulales bacterium]
MPSAATSGRSPSGNTLSLTSLGEVQIASTFLGSGVTETINAPLTLEGSYDIADNSTNGNLLNLGGAISSGTAGTQTLTVAGPGATAINGAIGNGNGTIALTKAGTGTLTLTGNNTFSGGLAVQSGTLLINTINNAVPAGRQRS